MKTLTRSVAMLLLCLCAAFGQTDTYTVTYEVSLEDAVTALAIQQPASGSFQIEIVDWSVQCSANCSIKFESNGAAATVGNSTAANVVALNPESTPADLVTTPKATAWYGSGVPAGTQVSTSWTLPGGSIVPFGSTRILSAKTGVNSNYIMRVAANYTGSLKVLVTLRARR